MLKLSAVLALVAMVAAVDYYDRPEETRRHMMGARLDGNSFSQDHEHREHSDEEAQLFAASAPAAFDSRTNWPKCNNVINFIKDQAACGSCWAVSASEVIADRFCISCGYGATTTPANTNIGGVVPNENMPNFELSAEELMSCCSSCGDGCQGGYPIDAMRRCYTNGFVSGGWFGSKCGCQSYKIDPTSHTEGPTPACKSNCDSSTYPEAMAADRHMCSKYYSVKGATTMQQEIMTNGPIECGFTVKQSFEDFFRDPANAKKVYDGKNGGWFDKTLGGHAIKVIGWGTSSGGENYWLINNSWNVTWADAGHFRYLRGSNLDGMEAGCVAAMAKCNPSATAKYNSLQCQGRDF